MFSDYSDHMNAKPICLHCLVEDGDEDLGRGLDLARKYGHVDFDVRTCERARRSRSAQRVERIRAARAAPGATGEGHGEERDAGRRPTGLHQMTLSARRSTKRI